MSEDAGLVRRWLGGWRGVAIDMRSPLPIDVARDRLRAGVRDPLRTAGSVSPGARDSRRVIGRVRDDGGVRLELRHATVRYSWRPVAHGGLEPDGTGCRLTGTLRTRRPVLIFSGCWLGGVAVFFLIGVLATIVALITGHAREAGGPAMVAAVGIGMFAFGAGLIGGGFALGRRDAAFLLDWLAAELRTGAGPADGLSRRDPGWTSKT